MVPLVVDGIEFIGGIHPQLHDLAEILWLSAVADGYRLLRSPTQTWGFAWRPIRGTTSTPTNHSAGTALDANSAVNWLGRADGGDVPRWLVDRMNRYGWRWGGDYIGRQDPMHWEFMGTVQDAAELTTQAEEEFMGLSAEEKAELKRVTAFLDALTGPLRPGKDVATATGAGKRVAKATLGFERDHADPDGVEH
jgi:hypothetical protein